MKLGVIGYGNRIQSVINVMQKLDSRCKVAAIVDPRKSSQDSIPVFTTAQEMMEALELDGIMIGTRCSLHTSYALDVLPSGIPLFLEKPVSTTMSDWTRLKQAADMYPTQVVVSHPLRLTSMVQLIKKLVDAGEIGTVEHVQAVNNVPYGGVYFHSWYRDFEETGGLFLQKATHDFDYLNYVIGQQPVNICAMTSKQVLKGDKPAGLKCVDCEENRTCEESVVGRNYPEDWQYCSFAKDAGNEDSGSAIIRYENGMHASYSQNFFVRRKAGTRGARFLGYKGTIEFDFMTGLVQVYKHHTPRVDSYQYDMDGGHFGGDSMLAENFINIMQGKEKTLSSLQDGLISALMCLKAKQSAESGTFQEINFNQSVELQASR